MADDTTIQRVPLGLLNVLGNFGGQTPAKLAPELAATIDALQFYGLNQRQFRSSTDAAIPEGGSVGITPSATNWTILFGADFGVVKTATMTALRMAVLLGRNGSGTLIAVSEQQGGPFGATETGFARCVWRPALPVIMPPGAVIFAGIDILGTDATASGTLSAEFGLFG